MEKSISNSSKPVIPDNTLRFKFSDTSYVPTKERPLRTFLVMIRYIITMFLHFKVDLTFNVTDKPKTHSLIHL